MPVGGVGWRRRTTMYCM